MKKVLSIVAALFLTITLCSCGVSEKDYETLQNRCDQLEEECNDLYRKYDEKKAEYDALQKEYDELKTDSAEWLEYSDNERATKLAQAKADRIAAEEAEKEARERQKAAEKAEREAAEKKAEEEARRGYDTGITFNNLARNPDDFKGEKVKFTGEVLQVIESDDGIDIRLATRKEQYGYYIDDVVYLYIASEDITSRILNGDIITVYGVSLGLYTYTSTTDLSITLPLILVDKYDFIKMN